MTEKLNHVYIANTALVAGKLEKEGKLGKYFDKTYENYDMDKSLELSEVKMQKDVIDILLKKTKFKKNLWQTIKDTKLGKWSEKISDLLHKLELFEADMRV